MINVKVKNIKALDSINKKVEEKERKINSQVQATMYAAKMIFMSSLPSVIGEKAKYFEAAVHAGPMGYRLIVRAKDEVGNYIYYGTTAHQISSTHPMPIGDGQFAMTVNHPGTKAENAAIDRLIRDSIRTAGRSTGLWR